MRALASAVPLLLLIGCGGPEFVARDTRGVWDPDGGDFWDRPLPSDGRREADGSFDLEDWPRALESDLLLDWFGVADRRLRGWGVSSGVFHRISGPIDPASLPESPEASLADDASVFLLDVDPTSPERGRRFPLWVRMLDDRVDRYTPEHLLAAVPVFGFVRRERTRYALVVTTDVRDLNGEPLGRSPAFHDAFEGGEADASAKSRLGVLRDALEAEGFDPDRVAAAAVFTTMDHSTPLRELADWAESLETPSIEGPWTLIRDHRSFQVFEAHVAMPVVQGGRRPYDDPGEGQILRGPEGDPMIVETQRTRLLVSIPKSAMPQDGFPVVLHLHGSGGDAEDSFDRGPLSPDRPRRDQPDPEPGTGPAEWLARRGVASIGVDFPLHGIRHQPPDTSGLLLYNLFGNIGATVDSFMVSAMELTLVARVVPEIAIDPSETQSSTAAEVALELGPASVARMNPERLTAMGQSMGSTIGAPWAAVDRRVKGIILSGSGGILVDIANHAVEPVSVKGVAELALRLADDGDEIHLFHPALHAAQNLWDLVDPVAKAARLARRPYPGIPGKHVLMTAGYRDGYFAPTSQAALAVALGAPLAGAPVEPVLADTLELAGIDPVSLPAQATVNQRTVGVLPYAAPFMNGHYVVFDQPGARYQYTCFAASVGTAGGATLLPARGLDDPCRR